MNNTFRKIRIRYKNKKEPEKQHIIVHFNVPKSDIGHVLQRKFSGKDLMILLIFNII